MKLDDIRSAFIDYFVARGHTSVNSSSLVPKNDPSLLFTNSGMVQFKKVFLGEEQRSYETAVTAQRCLRAGGKHNDLENIGHTARHHTFFEMLGNFSFGSYFKEQAITLAWEFLLGTLDLDPRCLWVTVHQSDDEAYEIWHTNIGIKEDRLIRIDSSDNFWSMGSTGPCGPCTEVFYDYGDCVPGAPPGSQGQEGDRYTEIWNLVFMQYNQTEEAGLVELERPCVDTGMGLERIASVLQGRRSNFETDLFVDLLSCVARTCQVSPNADQRSLKVIADHIRAITFLIADGILPGNENRSYVLRRIIRRAIRHGFKLGMTKPFLSLLVPEVTRLMGAAYPELESENQRSCQVVEEEEARFASVLIKGMQLLDDCTASMKPGQKLSGEDAFRLYDTYGFPLDLTVDVLRERRLEVDQKAFDAHMHAQSQRARAASQFQTAKSVMPNPTDLPLTQFTGYECLTVDARILGLYIDAPEGVQQNAQATNSLSQSQSGWVVMDRSSFYPEGGGQVADQGKIKTNDAEFSVKDCQKLASGVIVHHGQVVLGTLSIGNTVTQNVEQKNRSLVARNHTATHLMHKALLQVLGDHVRQKGSLVTANRLRFDFSHNKKVESKELRTVEEIVNSAVRENYARTVRVLPFDKAKETGACYMSDEDYGDQIRVVGYSDYSVEFCSGTHVPATGEIGFFKIVQESSIASGVRRIEALTGAAAHQWLNERLDVLDQLTRLSQSAVRELPERYSQMSYQLKKMKKSRSESVALNPQAYFNANGYTLYLQKSNEAMSRDKLGQWQTANPDAALMFLTANNDASCNWQLTIGDELKKRVDARTLFGLWSKETHAKGGGNNQMMQGGGALKDKVDLGLKALCLAIEKGS